LYYRLNKDCRLVKGAKRGAIYDFQSGKVYSINNGAVQLLLACQEHSLDKLLDVTNSNSKKYLSFLDDLTGKGVGSLYTFDPGIKAPTAEVQVADDIRLEFLWLELTSKCNNRCLHCYATSGPVIETKDCVPHERWLSLIDEARQAGATAIQLIGGEPLMYPKWRELVVKAKKSGYEFIEIFTNATLVDDSCINFFKENDVSIATTIYSDCSEIHDKVTLNQGSFDKTLTAIKKIIAAQIPLRIASIIMKANETEPQKIMDLCQQLGVEVNPPDVVRPTGRGDDKELIPSMYTKQPIKPPFYTDAESFAKAQMHHSCLAGKIAVTATGDIIPCIFARSQICGNILTESLTEVLRGQPLQQCWRTTKDHVEKCKDCEFRYACSDCRPLAQGSDPNKRWLACSCGCSYNPYTGKWEE
jgi:radical SAM protein with 4Fe4S-binding SPASM domain